MTVSQKLSIRIMSSCFVLGLTSRRIYSFNLCHMFSIGFASGDSGGVLNIEQPMNIVVMHELLYKLRCMFRIIILHETMSIGKTSLKKGSKVFSGIYMYRRNVLNI